MTRMTVTSTAPSGHANKRTPTSTSATVVGVGCSGTDPIFINGGIAWLVAQATGTTPNFVKSTIPGASIIFNRDNAPGAGQPWVYQNMAPYSCIHLGDNPNLDGLLNGLTLNQWAQKFWAEGNGGAGGEILLWSLQPVLQTTATAQRNWINANAARYDAAQDYCNVRRPGIQPLVRQIPGLQLMQRFFEDQEAGLAPGGSATWFRDLYFDTFHFITDAKGAYITSVIGAACMYGIDPKTMPNNLNTASGFTTAEAIYIKNCVSDVVKAFERSGVNTSAWL
jgi:hypothetical protein